MKTCNKCKLEKPLSEFPVNKTKKSGYQSSCKECTKAYLAEWRAKNIPSAPRKELVSDYATVVNANKSSTVKSFEAYYLTVKGRASHMLNNAKSRAKRKNIPFELDAEWIRERLRAGKCEVTNIPFVFAINGGRGHTENSFSPSIDRIVPELGYTKDNCRVICWIYNRARGAFPDSDFDYMISQLIEQNRHLSA